MEKTEYIEELNMWKEILEHNKQAMAKLKFMKFNKWFEILKIAIQMVEFLEAVAPFNKTNKFNSVASITYINKEWFIKLIKSILWWTKSPQKQWSKNIFYCFQLWNYFL